MPSFTRTAETRAATGGMRRRDSSTEPGGLLVLDRYRLHRPLGAGGFGTVWMAWDERLERDVAVKVLPRDRIVGGRFEREARAAARLSHPAIVMLYEAAVDDDGAYLVSELVQGATLSALLEAGRLSDRGIVEVGIAVCEALAHAHAQGVVHRDVKPSNVLIPEPRSGAGQVAKLTDFGVARLIGGDTLTRTGDVVGTAGYMAPEQAHGRQAGAAADLYSLALVLYEALSGVNPVALGPPAQRARRLGAHLPPLRRQRRDLPIELGDALDLALQPRPGERGTIDQLRADLLSSLGRVEDRPGIVEPAWPKRSPPSRDQDDPIADREPEVPAISTLRWPTRALAGACAGLAVGWLLSLALPAGPGAPAAGGAIAGLGVAALPRIGWLIATAAAAGVLAARGWPGAAIVVVVAALVPVLAAPRRGASWPMAAVAAALGSVSLAGSWPALAGRATGAWNRFVLGAVGWIWTLAAGALADDGLYTKLPAQLPAGWPGSTAATVDHVLSRVFAPGLLAPALLWGAAAVVVPWLTPRWRPAAVVLVTAWSAGVASGTVTILHLLHAGFPPQPGVVALGAVGGGIVALVPTLTSGAGQAIRPTDSAS
jgi:eukaryotic-like serine/threonine-protein kinase